jgi:ATP-dependent Lon protease
MSDKKDDNKDNTNENKPQTRAKYFRKIQPLNKKRKHSEIEEVSSTKEDENKPNKRYNLRKRNVSVLNLLLNIASNNKINNVVDEDETDEDYTPSDKEDNDDDDDDDDDDNSLIGKPVLDGLKKDILYGYDEVQWIKKLDEKQKAEIVTLENKILESELHDTPFRFRILKSPNLSDKSKSVILQQITTQGGSFSEEYYKMKRWINTLEKIPFDNFISPVINSDTNIGDIHNYLKNIKSALDTEVYGHEKAKQQIVSILAKEISNPKSLGNVFAIQGPMGNGKTTLVKHGICKAMNRPFGFVPLGGMQDSSYLSGHESTYVGSKPGRIVEILIESGCMNPVFYFDELDKVSDTPKGEEIMNVLCHLTDTTQNHSFTDKFFSGIDFNLSRATFIFSYNDESKINPILLDRMYKIRTDGFKLDSKLEIAKKFLLPKILNEFNFNNQEIQITDDVIKELINNNTEKESGVRNLKRCLEQIVSSCNILRYDPSGELLINKIKNFKLPFTININNLYNFIEKNEPSKLESIVYSMYL